MRHVTCCTAVGCGHTEKTNSNWLLFPSPHGTCGNYGRSLRRQYGHARQRDAENQACKHIRFWVICDVLTSAPPVVHWACCSTCGSVVGRPSTVTGTASLYRRQQATSSIVSRSKHWRRRRHRWRAATAAVTLLEAVRQRCDLPYYFPTTYLFTCAC